MAEEFTGVPAAMTPQEIQAGVFERLGFDPQQAQSFGYNVASDGTPTYPKSRRKMRMEEEFRKLQQEELQNQRLMQQMDIEQKELTLRELEQQGRMEDRDIARDAALAKAARDAKIKEQSRNIRAAFLGSTLPDGTKLNPINLEDADSPERIQRTMYMNEYGLEDQATKEMANMFLDDAFRIREKRATEVAEQEKADKAARVGLAKDLGSYGLSIVDFAENGKIDFEKANEAVGKAYASGKQAEEEKALSKEQRKSIVTKIDSAEEKLLGIRGREAAAQKRLEARPNSSEYRTELEAAQLERGIFEDEINRLNRMIGGGAVPAQAAGGGEPQSFDNVEAAEAAKLPKGTIVVIGGRRARID
jgi:hypothetical protein